MGRYIDWADVSNRYGDWAKGPDATIAGTIFIPQAEAEVDGRLAVKYSVPFVNSPAPELIRDLCIDLAYYKATIKQETSKPIWASLEERFKAILAGNLLVVTSAGALGGTADYTWGSNSYHSSFGPDDPINWSVDPDWIEAAQDARE